MPVGLKHFGVEMGDDSACAVLSFMASAIVEESPSLNERSRDRNNGPLPPVSEVRSARHIGQQRADCIYLWVLGSLYAFFICFSIMVIFVY